MYVSREWLSEFLDVSEWSGAVIADRMSRTGIEVEGVQNYANDFSGVVVGEVKTCVDHENSDHLHVTTVDVGDGTLRQIVCGAPNVAVGQKVMVALPGAVLPGNFKIKVGKLRGVESQGMLCALQELGFSDSVVPKAYADGLFILPSDAPLGVDIREYLQLDDDILELSITPNRADALSMRGVAHEVGAIISQTPHFKSVREAQQASTTAGGEGITVTLDESLSSMYQARVIENITVGESPLWLQMRLMKSGIRPINNIVDVTNYCLLLYGQPMHAFDLETLPSRDIAVRSARAGETLVTLDGVERHLTAQDTIITAGDVPIALAGVMGGQATEVTDKTRHILLETAIFDPIRVRETSKRFNLRSESSMRFEKGINIATISESGEQAAEWMAILGQGQVVPTVVTQNVLDLTDVVVELPYSLIEEKLGIQLTQEELEQIFKRLDFEVMYDTHACQVTIPKRRWDIRIPMDLIEEVARIYGYDRLPTTLPVVPSTPGRLNAKQRLVRSTRRIMEGFGLNQTISYVLTSPKQAELFRTEGRSFVKLNFPMSEDRSVLRQSLFPALLEIAKYNRARHQLSLAFYETGKVFFAKGENVQPDEEERLAIFVAGAKQEKRWDAPSVNYDFFDVKGYVEGYLSDLRLSERITYAAAHDIPELHPGRAARIYLDDKAIGVMGQLHPELANDYDLPENSYFAELDLDALLTTQRVALVQSMIPKVPSSSRDFSLLVPNDVSHQQLVQTIQQNGGAFLVNLELFDQFMNPAVFGNKRSLAYRLTFQNPEKTLTDDEINQAVDKVSKALLAIEGLEIR